VEHLAKKANWKTLAGLALAAATWRSIAEDLPIHDIITPPEPPDPRLPDRFTECPEGQERKSIGGQWRCWPKEKPPDPRLPTRYTECPEGQERKLIGGQWRCWPKEKPGGR